MKENGDSDLVSNRTKNGETELQAAERRIAGLRPCAAAKLAGMQESFRCLLEAVGEDPERQGLLKTPHRAARAFEFLTAGYRQSLETLGFGAEAGQLRTDYQQRAKGDRR